jgi:hypothetical protein
VGFSLKQVVKFSRVRKIAWAYGDWAIAYTIAILAGSVVFLIVLGLIGGDLSILPLFPLIAAVMALFALPGFIVLRLVFHWWKVKNVAIFAIGGVANSMALSISGKLITGRGPFGDDWMILASLGVAGAVSGALYRVIERDRFRKNPLSVSAE